VFIGIIIFLIIGILIFAFFAKANSKNWGDNEKVLESDKVNAEKALVVYEPSRSKLTTKIAEKIAEGINDAGYEVTVNNPGKHMPVDISKYSVVVFGSPIYMGQTSSILSDYMKDIVDFSNTKILLFVTGKQINNGELDKMEAELGNAKAMKVEFKNGVEDESKAYELGKSVAGN
jgi:flavodoxin